MMSRLILVRGVMAVKLAILVLVAERVGPTSNELAVVIKYVVATMATTARVADAAQQHFDFALVLVGGIGIVW